MKKSIGYRIRKLREQKDYSQQNMAEELKISVSAYSKIERGVTDPAIGRLAEIAKILEVDVTYFFNEKTEPTSVQDTGKLYGYATKAELEEVLKAIQTLKNEITALKETLPVNQILKKKVSQSDLKAKR